jgi:hypothetical protein
MIFHKGHLYGDFFFIMNVILERSLYKDIDTLFEDIKILL